MLGQVLDGVDEAEARILASRSRWRRRARRSRSSGRTAAGLTLKLGVFRRGTGSSPCSWRPAFFSVTDRLDQVDDVDAGDQVLDKLAGNHGESVGGTQTKRAPWGARVGWRGSPPPRGLSSDGEIGELLAGFERGGQPLRLQAAAGPGLAAGRIAILGGDLAAAGAGARAAWSWRRGRRRSNHVRPSSARTLEMASLRSWRRASEIWRSISAFCARRSCREDMSQILVSIRQLKHLIAEYAKRNSRRCHA